MHSSSFLLSSPGNVLSSRPATLSDSLAKVPPADESESTIVFPKQDPFDRSDGSESASQVGAAHLVLRFRLTWVSVIYKYSASPSYFQ
jgi:hypothetical protein